jgi:hypothetical protein
VDFEVIDGLDLFLAAPGWRLHLAHLALEDGSHEQVLGVIQRGTLAKLRKTFPEQDVSGHRNIGAVRDALGDGRPRATSERLAARVVGGSPVGSGSTVRTFGDLLTLRTLLPWTFVDARKVLFPLKFRLGEAGETGTSQGEPVDLEGVPLLADGRGIVASVCTDPDRTRLDEDAQEVIAVCYTPLAVSREFEARTELARMVWTTWAYRFVAEKAYRPEA